MPDSWPDQTIRSKPGSIIRIKSTNADSKQKKSAYPSGARYCENQENCENNDEKEASRLNEEGDRPSHCFNSRNKVLHQITKESQLCNPPLQRPSWVCLGIVLAAATKKTLQCAVSEG